MSATLYILFHLILTKTLENKNCSSFIQKKTCFREVKKFSTLLPLNNEMTSKCLSNEYILSYCYYIKLEIMGPKYHIMV